MTEENAKAQATDIPVLSLDDQSMAKDKADLEEAVAALEKVNATAPTAKSAKVAEKALQELDTSMLSDTEKATITEFAKKIDIENPEHVLLYGASAQKKVADFSDSALATVRTDQTGETGDMLVKLISEIKGFSTEADRPSGIRGWFWDARKNFEEIKNRYEKVDVNVDVVARTLEENQRTLLKDISMLNHLYDMNTQYFKELTMYIVAGEKKLAEVREGALKELSEKAKASGDTMDAQRVNDLATACDRFEKKIHDLKLTRTVALQMAPQIRLLQNNDSLLVERIQSTLSNTLPLWKSQIVIALGLARSQQALKAQTAVTNMTNELLRKNAEMLKMGTIETAKEAERGIIDVTTLAKTNQDLIDTITEVMTVQREGRQHRIDAEKQLIVLESQLKQKLLELKD
ncbi:MAG TPA: toxic anion resistance protein [Candidatus Limiplasma sp.]|nr:toxic anion resistance protein [Candidatus Limiplasma sp.]HRX08396.1 toxic anion resistance protein [Candidatus Limiplasma sp.]